MATRVVLLPMGLDRCVQGHVGRASPVQDDDEEEEAYGSDFEAAHDASSPRPAAPLKVR